MFVSLFCFTCFFLLIEEDGSSGSRASCSSGSLEDVGPGFGDRNDGETSVDLRFVSDCPESFWLGLGWDNWGSADGSCWDGNLWGTVGSGDGLGGGLIGPTLLLLIAGRVMMG